MYKRVVLKLSGEVMAGDARRFSDEERLDLMTNRKSDLFYDDRKIADIIEEISEAHSKKVQISIVIGGGNYWRGRDSKVEMNRPKSDQVGMLATVMNGIYLTDMLAKAEIPSVVMTPMQVGNFTIPFHRDLAVEYLEKGHIVLFAAGLGHPYFSTDTIAALRAAEIDADCVFYAKPVDGVYDKAPDGHSDAKLYKTLSYKKIMIDNLEFADIAAMKISQDAKTNSFVFNMGVKGNIAKACLSNEETRLFGTTVSVHLEEEYYE